MPVKKRVKKTVPPQLTNTPMLQSENMREKYWEELSLDEKIERLRTAYKSLSLSMSGTRQEIQTIKTHTHDEKGEAVIVKPLKHEYANDMAMKSIAQTPGKSYI